MKKAAIILSAICLGIVVIVLAVYGFIFLGLGHSGALYENEAKTSTGLGIFFLIFGVVYLILGTMLLCYTGNYVYSGNQVKLGVLILLFICVPGGIMIICLPRESRVNYSSQSSGFSQMMRDRVTSTSRNCERCGKNFENGTKFVVTITGKKLTICNTCYYRAKERGEHVTLLKKI